MPSVRFPFSQWQVDILLLDVCAFDNELESRVRARLLVIVIEFECNPLNDINAG